MSDVESLSGASSAASSSISSSRKRKRNAPEADDDEPELPSTPMRTISVPSRIKRLPKANQAQRAHQDQSEAAEAGPSTQSKRADSFADLGVRPWLVKSLAGLAIHRPTKVQEACIPHILDGRDTIGVSKTGSGKTVAFAVPILQELYKDPTAIFALVLTPTRELAVQIYEQFMAISSPHHLKALLVTGGRDMVQEAIELARKPHVVIATPGRLADHFRSSGEDTMSGLKRMRFLVVDEADRVCDSKGNPGMFEQVTEITQHLPDPAGFQTLFFTATCTPELNLLKNRTPRPGKKPVVFCEIDMEVLAIPDSLQQKYQLVQVTHREHYLHEFLLTKRNVEKTVIVFCNRASTALFLHHLLFRLEHRVTSLHSKLPQRDRTENLARFRASAARVLVATDVASRGLDIPEVGIVVNFDVPRNPDDYIHRVGRTARAGRKGEAVTFVGPRDIDLVLAIEKRVGRKMEKWEEDKVNLETRVLRVLRYVSQQKVESRLDMAEDREVGGRKTNKKPKLRAE